MSLKSKRRKPNAQESKDKLKSETQPFKKKFLESEKRYEDLVEHLPVGVYRTTPEGKIIEANQALADMLGYESHEGLKDINVKDLYVRGKDRTDHLKKLQDKGIFFAEFKLRRKDGRTIWGRDYPRGVVGASGRIEYFDGILVDITEQKKAEEKLKKVLNELEVSNRDRKNMIQELKALSLRDDLTGLYNRRGFFTIASEYIKRYDRSEKMMFLLFMDLDNLKRINDTLGHPKGDQALVEIASILKSSFRRSDVKGRMGGDEFAVFPIEASREEMEKVVGRLRKNIDEFNANKKNPFELSVSIGVSYYDPEYPCTIDELLVRADKLMYEEKRRKGRF
jgi:diguanylate cyclase (GGDEF)-like protein/PAS domain S-box-containing protein